MNERATLEKISATVDSAIAEGLADLGLPAEAVDVEILDAGSRGLLGIGGRQARVRLTIKGEAGAANVETPAKSEPAPEEDDILRLAKQTVIDLLDKMKVSAQVDARYGEEDEEGKRPIHIDIHGEDLGVLIGRRAEILNALQFVVNLIVSKQAEHWAQVLIDVEGYRVRRERQLRQIAQRLADQAVKTGHRQALEPMPASERRIIHMELRNNPAVTTESVGEEPARKVTIVPK